MKTREERYLERRSKKFFKLLNGLAKCNPEVQFLFDDENGIIADSKYVEKNIKREMIMEDLVFPKFGYSYSKYNKKSADIYAESLYENEPPIAYIEIDNSLKTLDESKYDNYYLFEAEESKIKSFFSNVKDKVKYFFSKRANIEDDLKSLEEVKKPVKIEPKKEETKEEPKKQEEKKEVVKETKKETPKKDIVLEKVYELYNKRAYMKLGEFERMFVDDAKAECLNPLDPEFNQMLNERTVNKEAIYNYYFEIEGNNIKKSFEKIYSDLGEYERMFVEDALAENLNVEDNEFRQMLNERAVNKEQVISFMKGYRENLAKQKDIINKYSKFCNINENDYKSFSINELRKSASENRNMLTGAELDKFKASKLKKDELVEIMNRIDAKKQEQEVSRKLGL